MHVEKMAGVYNVVFHLYYETAKGVGGGSDIEE
jgi:hypothetical protein